MEEVILTTEENVGVVKEKKSNDKVVCVVTLKGLLAMI